MENFIAISALAAAAQAAGIANRGDGYDKAYSRKQNYDSGVGLDPYETGSAISKPTHRTQGGLRAKRRVTKYEQVEERYDLFMMSRDRAHIRVGGQMDTGAGANYITLNTLEDLGFDGSPIEPYEEEMHANLLHGRSIEIIGYINLNWYFAEDSGRRYQDQFDVIDPYEDCPVLIGRETINRRSLLVHPVHKDRYDELHLVGKRKKRDAPKNDYEAPQLIFDTKTQEYIIPTDKDEQGCRQAAASPKGKSSLLLDDKHNLYKIYKRGSDDYRRIYK